jgi:hypothetical protein
MRNAGNFNPEWGYVAPAPNFLRTARLFAVAAAIGATASAAVVFSLMDRPAAETSVAARTLVRPVEPAVPARSAPLVAQVQTQSEPASVPQTPRADAAGAIRPQGAAVVAHAGEASPAVGESNAAPPTPRPIAAALAESPRIATTEAPPARALASESNAAAAPEVAPAAAAAAAPTSAPASAPRAMMKKPRAVARAAAPRYDVPRYAAPRYEPRYYAMERGAYAFMRQYGAFGQEY